MTDDQDLTPTKRNFGPGSSTSEASHGLAGEMFTARELEQILKISVKTIYRYVQQGLIPYVRIQSNVRFPKQQILQWIERQSYQPWSPNASTARRP
jgi:excisionase family DNA binding protein